MCWLYRAMVVAELLRWRAPAALILLLVALVQNPALVASPSQLPNDFVEIFSGDAAVTLACWDRGMVGSCHDITYTSLMDLTTTHGFLSLVWNIDQLRILSKTNFKLWLLRICKGVRFI